MSSSQIFTNSPWLSLWRKHKVDLAWVLWLGFDRIFPAPVPGEEEVEDGGGTTEAAGRRSQDEGSTTLASS